MKVFNVTTGLPRACSTLLQNVLAQNPQFHATPSSGLIDLLYPARKNFTDLGEFHSMEPKDAESLFINFARGGLTSAYDNITDRPIIFDKGRSWIGYLDLLFQIIPDAKVLVTVRDIRGILASIEKLRIQHPAYFHTEENPATEFTTIEKRVQKWLAGPKVGIAIERLYEACRVHKNKIHIVHAESLTNNFHGEMKKIYDYLGYDFFKHDPNNIIQYTHEHDGCWGIFNHKVAKTIKPISTDWDSVLGHQLAKAINEKFSWVNHI